MNVCEWNVSWKVLENMVLGSWKTLEFGLSRSWKVLEISGSVLVRTLPIIVIVTLNPNPNTSQW